VLSLFSELLFFDGKENITKRKPPNKIAPSGNLRSTQYNGAQELAYGSNTLHFSRYIE
jgi:hypothetical protein